MKLPAMQFVLDLLQGTASVEGTVLDDVTGEPVRDAEVKLIPGTSVFPGANGSPRPPASQPAPKLPYSTTTDSSGHFAIQSVLPGAYRIGSSASGYINSEEQWMRSNYLALDVVPGKQKPVVVRLTPSGAISGQIVREDRQPLANYPVFLLRALFDINGNRKLAAFKTTTTSDTGRYTFSDITPGRYYVAGGRSVSFGRSQQNAPLYPWTFYPGKPDAIQAGEIEVAPRGNLGNIDFVATSVKSLGLRGTLIDSRTGKPPEKASVFLKISLPFENSGAFGGGDLPYDSSTGQFYMTGLFSGSYAVAVDLPVSSQGGDRRIAPTFPRDAWHQFSITDSDVDLMIRVPRSGGIHGQVNLLGAKDLTEVIPLELRKALPPPNGITSGPFVSFSPIGPNLQSSNVTFPLTVDGVFDVPYILSGRFQISVVNIPIEYYFHHLEIDGMERLGMSAEFHPEDRSEVRIVLANGSGNVRGVVVNYRNEPMAGISGFLLPDPLPEEIVYSRSFYTDQNGSFSIAGVRPDRYRLYPLSGLARLEIPEPGRFRRSAFRATPVVIAERAQVTVSAPILD